MGNNMAACLDCGGQEWEVAASLWSCKRCGRDYPCLHGIPQLVTPDQVSDRDRGLRERLYDGLLGRHYDFLIPLLTLPARPVSISKLQWTAVCLAWLLLVGLVLRLTDSVLENRAIEAVAILAVLGGFALFFRRHPYLFWLLLLALPVKLVLRIKRFTPQATLQEVHQQIIGRLSAWEGKLKILDVSTGSCNSLLRHGWIALDAEFCGADLSMTMLLKGAEQAASQGVPIELYLADAHRLPFPEESFDVVLNYGALNAYADQGQALEEMGRVVRCGGLVVCLDEQLYPEANWLEGYYFRKVLAGHDRVDAFPRTSVPFLFSEVEVHQVYEFYYLAVLGKSP